MSVMWKLRVEGVHCCWWVTDMRVCPVFLGLLLDKEKAVCGKKPTWWLNTVWQVLGWHLSCPLVMEVVASWPTASQGSIRGPSLLNLFTLHSLEIEQAGKDHPPIDQVSQTRFCPGQNSHMTQRLHSLGIHSEELKTETQILMHVCSWLH